MKKIFFTLFILFLIFTPLFADDGDSVRNESKAKEAAAAEFFNSDYSDELIGTTHKTIDKIMSGLVGLHNKAFGINDNGNPFNPTLNLQRRISDFKTGGIFNLLVAFFLIFSTIRYGFKMATKLQFQSTEVVGFIIRTVFIFVIFLIMPYIPTMLIKLAFGFAEIITGTPIGTLGFASAMQTPGVLKSILGAGGATAAMLLSKFGTAIGISFGGFFTINLDLSSLSIIGILMFGICFAGLISTFIVSLQFCWKCLDLYLANLALVFLLPTTLYEGFGFQLKSVFQYFYKNFVEIIMGGLIILMVNKLDVLTTVLGSGPYVNALKVLLRPTLLIVGMHYSAKVASTLTRGEITDTDSDIQGAVSTVGKAAFGSSILTSTVSKIKSARQQKELRNVLQNLAGNSSATNNKNIQK